MEQVKDYTNDWQKLLCYDDWNDFLTYTKNDTTCNAMWLDYSNGKIYYDELSRYEYALYIDYIRNKKLELVLG